MLILAVLVHLSAAEPVNINCSLVRQYVAEHGKAKALAWAIKEGYSWRQIAEAKRCLSH